MSGFFKKLQERFTARLKSSEAKSFKAQQLTEEAYDARNRGTQHVPVAQIIGSVGRYHDFDRQFRLRQPLLAERLEHVKRLMQNGVPLPPVKLYQIKDEYYVLDGNHRVAAAKELGCDEIAACIMEFLPSKNTLENILYREKVEFLEKTGLQEDLTLTEVGQYAYLLYQIQSHQQALEQERKSPLPLEHAAADWYTTIYQPLIALIQQSGLLASFPQRTLADLYTFISLHQWQKGQARTYSREIDDIIPNNMEEFRKAMASKTSSEYPEMQREITAFVLMTVSARREYRVMEKLFSFDEVREIHSVHGSVDLIAKIVLSRDFITSDAETISHFVNQIRQVPGVINTQTLIPGVSKIKPPR